MEVLTGPDVEVFDPVTQHSQFDGRNSVSSKSSVLIYSSTDSWQLTDPDPTAKTKITRIRLAKIETQFYLWCIPSNTSL